MEPRVAELTERRPLPLPVLLALLGQTAISAGTQKGKKNQTQMKLLFLETAIYWILNWKQHFLLIRENLLAIP